MSGSQVVGLGKRRTGSGCLMGTGFPFGVMKCSGTRVVVVIQHHEFTKHCSVVHLRQLNGAFFVTLFYD